MWDVAREPQELQLKAEREWIEPGSTSQARRQRVDAPQRRLGDGRQMPRLVFATDPALLSQLIGAAAVQQISASLQGGPHVFVTGRGDELLARVRTAIKSDTAIKGVVLLGGYGVVPSQIISTLPAELADLRIPDRDRLQVWSDDGYGDRDGDGVPELPVSRVPDGRSAEFLLGALKAAPQRTAGERSGIRNIRRPFANGVRPRPVILPTWKPGRRQWWSGWSATGSAIRRKPQ